MKTELTNEIKAKLFAMYIGQEVITMTRQTQGEGKPSKYLKGILKEVDLGMGDNFMGVLLENEDDPCHYKYYSSDEAKLLLKPISDITDEDAVHVAWMLKMIETKTEANRPRAIKSGKYITNRLFEKYGIEKADQDNIEISRFISCTQFLVSEGYDVPQYLLGGYMIKSGLAFNKNTILTINERKAHIFKQGI